MRNVLVALAASLAFACGGDQDTDLGEDLSADSGLVEQPSPDERPQGDAGRATLRDAQGNQVATATLTRTETGVAVEVHATGIAPGSYGTHIHMVGRCDAAAAFESAGDHLNTGARQHGLRNPNGPHVGDLENLTVSADGTGHLRYTNAGLIPEDVHDSDGSALVVHAATDDQFTDPSGNSGTRQACGVIER